MAGIMVDKRKGGRFCTFEDVVAVPLPERTRTYQPLANGDAIRLVQSTIVDEFGCRPEELQSTFALSQNDQQMFGCFVVPAVANKKYHSQLMYAFRNSYNKTASFGMAGGAHCWGCDNGQMSGEIVLMRKHTANILGDLQELCSTVVSKGVGVFNLAMVHNELLQEIEVEDDFAHALIGIARGRNVIRSQQAEIVYREWQHPSFEGHSGRDAHALYNCFTQGAKHGPAGQTMQRHRKVHKYFEATFPQLEEANQEAALV